MTDRPIIFSAPMVRALLDGTKTQTRRVLKPQPDLPFSGIFKDADHWWTGDDGGKHIEALPIRYTIGDRLWVRENWFVDHMDCMKGPYLAPEGMAHDELVDQAYLHFAVTDDPNSWECGQPPWRPSIHMPRWASRLTLIVTDVRVELLQDISEEDALAEGIEQHGRFFGIADADWDDAELSASLAYRTLWNSINGPDAWDANPWVVAVSFEVHQCNIDQMGKQQEAT